MANYKIQPMRFGALFIILWCSIGISFAAAQSFVSSDFEANFKKPPAANAKKRITIQIAPRANPAVMPPPNEMGLQENAEQPNGAVPGSSEARSDIGRYSWFWDVMSPDLAASGPGRLQPALVALRNAPASASVSSPRLQSLQAMVDAHGRDLLLHSAGTQVSPALALAVMAVESAGKADAQSHAGATGLMQLMPATAERFGVVDRLDPTENIKGGIAFLDFLMTTFDGDPLLVLAGYNAGENSIPKHQGVPPYAETRDYVPKVLAAFETARGLCLTPPELISDGCAFASLFLQAKN